VNEYPLNNRTICSLGASQRDAILSIIGQRLAELSPERKKILAMYYHEEMQMHEIAACFKLAEAQICEVHAQTVALLRNDLAAALAELYTDK
jgi:DNA-directed RNA polymerase specialized sigma subunit